MFRNFRFHICHTAVADLDCVSVQNFIQVARNWEVLIDEIKERLSYICLHSFAEWWVTPDYSSSAFSLA